ncbi:MAG: sensor histidine kinase [Proteobacteria bacterium]|nr:sensor histidine kinase [Pseudomonadota bacterium]
MPHTALLHLRRAIVPDAHGHGWAPLASLGFLLFLFMPLALRVFAGVAMPFHLGATLASIVLFLPLYALAWRREGGWQLAAVLGIFALACALVAFNTYANTYVIYAASLSGALTLPPRWRLALLAAMLAGFVAWVRWLGAPGDVVWIMALITIAVGVSVFFSTQHQVERDRKRAELKLTQDEVRRIAAVAERERIGRDLHDLLGHTLSLVALKAELASKLALRDAPAAEAEMQAVAHIAREALSQVRSAVSGIRHTAIAGELASARLLLEAEGLTLSARLDAVALPAEAESVLALTLREAATNVQRHAQARSVAVRLMHEDGAAVLQVDDDGCGRPIRPGHGLRGMRERIEALGGQLDVQAQPGRGTRLAARLPLEPQP